MKIDTSGWKEFKLIDLFEVYSSKKIFHANTIKNIYDFEKEGTYPYVVRSAIDNGIRGYIRENENYLNPANTLSFAQDTFSVFYQEKPYFTGNKIKVLVPQFKGFNKINALFIVANFKKLLVDFTWGNSSTTNSIKNIIIKFPVKENMPDWEYMENTIKATEQEIIDIIKEHELRICYISRIKWKKFKLIDLFELHLAKGDLQPKKLENGDIPLVSAGMTNNGIVMNIKEGDGKSEKFNSNVITIDMFGKAFYQNKDFFAVSHGRVNILKPKFKLNYYIGSFFVSVFDKKLIGDFSFSKMCSQGRLQNETILLPVNKKGMPDFELMENFIKQIEKENNSLLKMIRKVK